ncbi:hypothetical protein [Pacificoceanicola onchidii]|uniref:hypothetical protein n=1 Tax=Pacificoceanicola onchidii TaxID=2562685 RepID=UPI0010A5FE56|nr:hypothetical protein [Pacificoceanicola onchidii]
MNTFVAALSFCLSAATVLWAGCDLSGLTGSERILIYDVVDADTPRAVPLLTVFSDGRVRVAMPGEARDDHIGQSDVRAMFQAIETAGLARLTSEEIAGSFSADGAQDGRVPINRVADGATSFVVLDVPGCEAHLSVANSAFHALAHPEAEALQSFREIELRLLNIVTAVQTR